MSKAHIVLHAQTIMSYFINSKNYLTFFGDKVMKLVDALRREPG